MPLTEKILETGRTDPARIALQDKAGAVSYGEILVLAPHVYELLARLAEKRGRLRVAISEERALDAAFILAMLSGFDTTTLILDHKWPLEHRVRAVKIAAADVLITEDAKLVESLKDEGWSGVFKSAENTLEESRRALAAGARAASKFQTGRPDAEPFLVIFTSGTTDLPKAFYRTRKAWRHNLLISKKYLRADHGIKTIAPGPLAYSLTLYALIETLGTAGTLYLQSRFVAQAAIKLIADETITRLVAVPAVLPALTGALTRSQKELPLLQEIILGGAALTPKNWADFSKHAPNARLRSYYGAAEIGFIAYSDDPKEEEMQLFEGLEVSIRDEKGAEVSRGEIGEIHVRVPSQADGYLATSGGAQITGPGGFASVGDRGALRGTGLVLAGRAGDMVVTGGHNVSLMQIDRVLETKPGALPATAVAIADEALGKIVVAVIESVAAPDQHEWREFLRKELPPQFLPRQLFWAPVLPRTVGGKIRRGETREELLAGKYERFA